MNIDNNLRTMAIYTDIMTNGATQATKMVNRLDMAQMATTVAGSLLEKTSQIQAQAVAKLMGVGSSVDKVV